MRGSGPALARRGISARSVLLLVVLAVALASVVGPAQAYWQQRTELIALRADIAAREADVSSLRHQVSRWNDPAYVKAQARSRLHVVMPGETGYVVVQASPTPPPSSSTDASTSALATLATVAGPTNPLASASPTPTPRATQ